MPESNFEFVCQLLGKFFKRSRVTKALDAIYKEKITGWEKWFEIELALYFSNCDDLSESKTQFTLESDNRKTSKNKFIPDFGLRRKNYAKNKFIIIELKCNKVTKKCIKGMLEDLQKFYKIKNRQKKEKQMRSFFVVGVHKKENKPNVIETIISVMKNNRKYQNLDVDYKAIKSRKITGTNYSFTLI